MPLCNLAASRGDVSLLGWRASWVANWPHPPLHKYICTVLCTSWHGRMNQLFYSAFQMRERYRSSVSTSACSLGVPPQCYTSILSDHQRRMTITCRAGCPGTAWHQSINQSINRAVHEAQGPPPVSPVRLAALSGSHRRAKPMSATRGLPPAHRYQPSSIIRHAKPDKILHLSA